MSGSSAPCSSAAAALDRAGVQPCGTLLWTGWTLQAGSVSVSVCVCVCVVCVCGCGPKFSFHQQLPNQLDRTLSAMQPSLMTLTGFS